MEKAKVTITRVVRDVGTDVKSWLIPEKHLWALTNFLDWAQKNGDKKRRTYVSKRQRGYL